MLGHHPINTITLISMTDMNFDIAAFASFDIDQRNRWFARLQRESRPRVKKAIRNRWKKLDRESVDQLYCDAFHKAFLRLEQGRSFDSLEGSIRWMVYTANLLQRSAHRQAKRNAKRRCAHSTLTDHQHYLSIVADDSAPDPAFEARLRAIEDAVVLLKPRQRAIFIAFHIDGRSMEEIAHLEGYANANSAKKAVCLARNQVREYAWRLLAA